ncbi:MAG: phenylalanine--tRNA ligase subunit beta [Phycisphaerales bacterium]|nr:MAG: phenylalanine--tRNA ligase subunit beta [Phycisphaerales bacterium]
MNISLEWLNAHLAPGPDGALSPDQAEEALTHAGFPIEERLALPGGDVRMDVEITSNRGDCLSHIGLAREAAAATGRRLVMPGWSDPKAAGAIDDHLELVNETPELCPLFTARVIRNVKVGPSPDWLVRRLEAVGQRSINNVVDVTNFINFELGHPCHVFDLAKLAGRRLTIRCAEPGEKLTTLDGKARTLRGDELVVADDERATSLAGVIGGADSEVSQTTTDVVLEMATWDPVTVRTAARAHKVRTDASYRFERGVSPLEIDYAATRAAALICELTGGTLCQGALSEGAPDPEPIVVTMRPARCRQILGYDLPDAEMIALLRAIEVGVEHDDPSTLVCTIPAFRGDLTREIDLIEEICRLKGFSHIPTPEKFPLRVRAPQEEERAMRELARVLTGLGFSETVTFSFVSPKDAEAFVGEGLRVLGVDDERRGAEPTLRPSVLPSLLACRRKNQDAQAAAPGTVRLYETSAVFAETTDGRSAERPTLAMLLDTPGEGTKRTDDDLQAGVRLIRGTVEAIGRAMADVRGAADFEPCDPPTTAWRAGACARVRLVRAGDEPLHLGTIGLLSDKIQKAYDLEIPVVAAELDLAPLLAAFPPRSHVQPLPAFPPIERDLSLIVDEATRWGDVEALIAGAGLERLEAAAFVSVYRGKQLGEGKKSLSLRLRFRDPARTLRHEEVDPQVERAIDLAKTKLNATLRA